MTCYIYGKSPFDGEYGFYLPDSGVDGVVISQEEHDKLLEENSNGKIIIPNENGYPYASAYIPSDKEIKQAKIMQLKDNLSSTDYVVIKINEGVATIDEYSDILAKRKLWRAEINKLEEA